MPKIKKEYVVVATLAVALLAVIVIPVMYACERANNADEQSHDALLKVGNVEKTLLERIEIVDDRVQVVSATQSQHAAVRVEMDKAARGERQHLQKSLDQMSERLNRIPLAGGE